MGPSEFDTGSNVLVRGEGAAVSGTASQSSPADGDVLAVVYDKMPEEWYADFVSTYGEPWGQLAIVTVGETMRSAAAPAGPPAGTYPGPWIDALESTADLGRLGSLVDDYLDAWDDTTPTTVYFDSLTALLRHVDMEKAFRFLHAISWRVADADAVGYYGLEPDGHDEAAVAKLNQLFDAEVTAEDGEPTA